MALRSPWTRHACLSEGAGAGWAATQGAARRSLWPKSARLSKKPAGASSAKFFKGAAVGSDLFELRGVADFEGEGPARVLQSFGRSLQ